MVNFGPLAGRDRFVSLGHLSNFQRVSRLGSVTARHSSSGREPNFAVSYKEWNYRTFSEAPSVFGRSAITLGIGPHSSIIFIFLISLLLALKFGASVTTRMYGYRTQFRCTSTSGSTQTVRPEGRKVEVRWADSRNGVLGYWLEVSCGAP